jgi:hypothetical protein
MYPFTAGSNAWAFRNSEFGIRNVRDILESNSAFRKWPVGFWDGKSKEKMQIFRPLYRENLQ